MTDQLKRAISAAKTAQTNSEQAEAISLASSSAGDQHFDMSESSYKTSHTAVRKARRFAMQGLYEWLMTDRRFDTSGKLGWKDNAPHDIAARTRATNAMHTVHIGYYHEMMRDIPEQIQALDALISQQLDREVDKLDTVEHAILLIGAYELQNRLEIPYKVVMDEAMKLNNHFGATDAHKLINAVLDKMAVELRAAEVQADTKANKRNSQRPAALKVAANTNEPAISAETESSATTSTKPRISANNASVKRNRPTKVSAGTSTAQAAAANTKKAQQQSVKPVAAPQKDESVAEDAIINDTVINEKAIDTTAEQNSLLTVAATVASDEATVDNSAAVLAVEDSLVADDAVAETIESNVAEQTAESKVTNSDQADNEESDTVETDSTVADATVNRSQD
ncbi:transcription antitermination factor NusB [Psychrobacter sp. TAE2020]|uniref:transcription antitermination factor NusB n=1 Tax=Psychrobacter sp. TAE2020 TaxID=2846762 RepID=UPI001C10A41B|nr:transcription antitermination factor NusB [Psychrobacter sp. TAE2020]MBU5617218.1 transcription antitermination factor NusB [Psychrobacter sp. TAE2020]